MGLSAGQIATKADIDDLKSKIKAEMKRRKYNPGSLNVSANTGNFSTAITQGSTKILASHFNETVGLLNKIKNQGINGPSSNPPYIKALNVALTNVTNYAKRSVTASGNDCSSNCTGLCATTCSGGCKGSCSGSCSGHCGDSCNTGCNSTCAGGSVDCALCAAGCQGQCSQYCYGST